MVRESVNSNNVMDMNAVNVTCNALLENEEEINSKKYIKSLLQSHVTNVLLSRPLCRRKPENIHSDQFNKKLVVGKNFAKGYYESTTMEIQWVLS